MLTRRGWVVAAGSLVLLGMGRLLGLLELYVLAAGAAALPVLALVLVRLGRVRLRAGRQLKPPRVHAGSEARAELTVRNVGRRRTPVLGVRDPFSDGRRQARFLLAPLDPGEEAHAAYRLPTDRRGVYGVGPLEISLSDAFGLASLSVPAAARTELTVYPRIDRVVPLPHTRSHDPLAGVDHARSLGPEGDEFHSLRAYEIGDDLRRVHWPSTARTGELMIRQDQMPWQARATVLLDLRAAAHTAASLELAVSAACSILTASWQRRSLVRLVGTDGFDSGFANGQAHMAAIMERLAIVSAHRGDGLVEALTGLRTSGKGGALAAVVAHVPDRDLEAIARLRTHFGAVTIVRFERSSYDPGARFAPDAPAPPNAPLVRVTAHRPFAEAWNARSSSWTAGSSLSSLSSR